MQHTYSDEYGFLDYSRSHNGSGMSQKAQAKHFVSELSRLAERNGDSTFSLSQLRDITQVAACIAVPLSLFHSASQG